MTDYREINELAKNPARAQSLARFLLALPDIDWTDWERDFLEPKAAETGELSTRQAEKLIELRNNAIRYRTVSGYNLAALMEKCWLGRDDLANDDDVAFIASLKAGGQVYLTRPQALRLKRCATELGHLEPHTSWQFPIPTVSRF
jgi:hypothetical protein